VATIQDKKKRIILYSKHSEQKQMKNQQPTPGDGPLAPLLLQSGQRGKTEKKNERPGSSIANLERGERLALRIDGRVEPQVLSAESAPDGVVSDGGAEARAGAGERRCGARAGP